MSSPSETTVARVIDAHTPTGSQGNITCWCGQRFESWAEHAMHVAPLILGALGLREEVSVRVGQLVGCVMSRAEAEANPGVAEIVATRWLSPWVAGDPGANQ